MRALISNSDGFSLRGSSLPVIVCIVLIINIGILTGVLRFG
jgi:hypothetical protein